MKDDNIKELIANHNYFMRTVISEALTLICVLIIMSIAITLIAMFVKDSIWIIIALGIAYLIFLFAKIGKIKTLHEFVTNVEDKNVKNTVHKTYNEHHESIIKQF